MTVPLLKVLRVMVDAPLREHYGLELMQAAGLRSGTLYPVLKRLEVAGWIEGRWEDPAAAPGRPPRKFYMMTTDGMARARHALAEAHMAIAPRGVSARPVGDAGAAADSTLIVAALVLLGGSVAMRSIEPNALATLIAVIGIAILGVSAALVSIVMLVSTLVGGKLGRQLADAVAEEVETRVSRAPAGLVWLASRRLPEPQRSDLRAEWMAELAKIAQASSGTPVTSYVKRILRSLSFSADLLRVGRSLRQYTPAPAPARGGHTAEPRRVDSDLHEFFMEIYGEKVRLQARGTDPAVFEVVLERELQHLRESREAGVAHE
jgi:hypothetical protein